jgi:hypothetical protein
MNMIELLARTGTEVLDQLERETTIPVLDGLQAQGDLMIIPLAMVNTVDPPPAGSPLDAVPPQGVELVRGIAGNNPHTLVADPGTCRWTRQVRDRTGLAIAIVVNTAPAYLLHPEHGANGIAPGCWLVRRQQERGQGAGGRSTLIAD